MFDNMHCKIHMKKIIVVMMLLLLVKTAFALSGCCESFCKITEEEDCPSGFNPLVECEFAEGCNFGCCIDKEGYCLSNYIKGNCERQGFRFVEMECDHIRECTTEIVYPALVGYTGYPVFYGSDSLTGEAYIEPRFTRPGDIVKIGLSLNNFKNVSKIESRIMYGDRAIDKITLYDDGYHNDRNKGDGFFARNWRVPDEVNSDIYKLDMSYIFYYKNGSVEDTDQIFEITISRMACMPIDDLKENAEINLIIMRGDSYYPLGDYQRDVDYHALEIVSQQPFFDEYEKINFYRVGNRYPFGSFREARNIISRECSIFNLSKDFILILNPANKYCKNESRVIEMDPLSFYYDAGSFFSNADEAFQNFCYYATTEQEYYDWEREKPKAPSPSILTSSGTLFTTENPEIDFIIRDNFDQEIAYELYAYKDYNYSEIALKTGIPIDELLRMSDDEFEDMLETYGISFSEVIVEGRARNNVLSSAQFMGLDDGEYEIWMYATDSDDNMDGTEPIRIRVKKDLNVSPHILYPQDNGIIASNTLPLSYIVYYYPDKRINYTIYIDSLVFKIGEITSNEINTKTLSLFDGNHSIILEGSYNNTFVNSTAVYFRIEPTVYLSPRKADFENVILGLLLVILSFLLSMLFILYHKK